MPPARRTHRRALPPARTRAESPRPASRAATEPTDTAASSDTPTPEPTPDATPEATPEATEPPPSIEVTPRPDGAIEIASDVVIVGSAAGYSPDGSRFAFSARPADGSAGPDVYVWRVGDRKAQGRHDRARRAARRLDRGPAAGQPGRRRRAQHGDPRPRRRTERLAGDGAMWRPRSGPERKVAAWWDGTVRLADDGMTWVPDRGRLVLGDWPNGGADAQVLADGGVDGLGRPVGRGRDAARGLGLARRTPTRPASSACTTSTPRPVAPTSTIRRSTRRPHSPGSRSHPGRLAWSAPADGGDTQRRDPGLGRRRRWAGSPCPRRTARPSSAKPVSPAADRGPPAALRFVRRGRSGVPSAGHATENGRRGRGPHRRVRSGRPAGARRLENPFDRPEPGSGGLHLTHHPSERRGAQRPRRRSMLPRSTRAT